MQQGQSIAWAQEIKRDCQQVVRTKSESVHFVLPSHAVLRERRVLCNGDRFVAWSDPHPPTPSPGLKISVLRDPHPSFGLRKFSVLRDPPPQFWTLKIFCLEGPPQVLDLENFLS